MGFVMPRINALLVSMLSVVMLSTALCADALAQSRQVFVNGQRLSDAQVADLARANCNDIPNGAYWLNTRSGAWGYAGNRQVQGILGDGCRKGGSAYGNAVGRHGGYATLRRAEEVANEFRAQGYRARAFHSGDGYYVDVWR
jgi:hypothetical protein